VPPESARGLWYDNEINRFRDEAGEVIHNMLPYFFTWEIDEWKRTKKYSYIKDRKGEWWEIFWEPIHCTHHCLRCRERCEIYDFIKEEYYDR
jgi:hypothetical protein